MVLHVNNQGRLMVVLPAEQNYLLVLQSQLLAFEFPVFSQ